jgi:hypothetical protein
MRLTTYLSRFMKLEITSVLQPLISNTESHFAARNRIFD